jgi:DNA repair ATPase RecN
MNGQQSNTHSRRANYSYIEEQNEARTELLNSKVNQLKHLAVQIGEETKFQNKYLKV